MADLRVRCFNVPGADPALMAAVRQAFLDEGFSSVAQELLAVLNGHFGKYELPVAVPGYDAQRSDTLADPEGRVLCRVSLETAARLHPGAHVLAVSAVSDAEEGQERAMGVLWRCVDRSRAKLGLPEETREVERITTSLETPSPNGKLLARPGMGPALRCLYHVQCRRLVGRIVTTFGTEPATREALLRAVTVAGAGRPPKKALGEVLGTSELFRESYLIGCPDCGERAYVRDQAGGRAGAEAGGRPDVLFLSRGQAYRSRCLSGRRRRGPGAAAGALAGKPGLRDTAAGQPCRFRWSHAWGL